ncbi:MAG: hypothetical protein B6D56_07260 [Candidatus Omnitrophica bacterium 4484_70.1]|nr:MAG: hypothetical protein B6D56_07260 [Candidatus Omnitrophica bacterium 4484_70.1]
MRVGFEFIFDESPLMIEVAWRLKKEYGVEVIGVSCGNRWKHLLKKKRFKLVNLGEYLAQNWEGYKFSKATLSELEGKYGEVHNIWWFIDVDRFINNVNRKKFSSKGEKLKLLCLHFKFWEEFYSRYHPDYFYTTGIHCLALLTSIAVAQHQQVKFRSFTSARFPQPRFLFVSNYLDEWEEANNFFGKILNLKVSDQELKEAYDFLNMFLTTPSKPFYVTTKKSFDFYFYLVREFFRRLKWKYVDGWGKDRFEYFTPPLLSRTRQEIEARIKKVILYKFYFNQYAYKTPPPGMDYLFCTLQVQPEEATDLWGMYHSNQIAFIENIAKSLPLNVKLLVKEHIPAVGWREGIKKFYEKINRISNVELVHPLADTYEFIKKAKAVVVNSGTVGWEALLFKKPVIIFGEAFYNHSGLTYRVENFRDFRNTLKIILHKERIFPDNYEDILTKFIYSLLKNTFPGEYAPYYCGEERILSEENINKILIGILRDIKILRD